MKIWLLVVLVVVWAGASSALTVNVMTYNIRYGTADDGENAWPNRRELLMEQLREGAADTIGLQEALRFQIDEIRAALPQYGEVGIGRDGGIKGEYSCILYNTNRFEVIESGTFWLSETPETRSQDWGSACVRICTWALLADRESGAPFYHFNTHFDHQSTEARLKGMQLIIERIAGRDPSAPFVLTGDFNAGEDSPPLLTAKNGPLPMVDTFRVLHPRQTQVGTFNRFSGDAGGAKIDYILTTPDVKVRAAEIDQSMPDGRCISDHFPVTAVLRF